MTIRIQKNPAWSAEEHAAFMDKLKANDGYCPCMLQKTPETKCMCQQFKDMIEAGESGACHCGRYILTQSE